MYTDYIDTPLGMMECKASNEGIRQLIFCGPEQSTVSSNEVTDVCKVQLLEYFKGQRQQFDLPLDPQGTVFQKQVWHALRQIPFGQVMTYLDIAKMVNKSKGAQAVGGANGRNPITLIVPCHRVIASSGALTGYAGGLERKLWLLAHEGIKVKSPQPQLLPQSNELHNSAFESVIKTRQAKTQFLD
ncbi:methylated-DNA--[protein]-cysteine S-methyltransferase [Shewanella surugensis]|uniref:Methylated-DNA--protein-cysteine methyltransferase n=1 Tax=Shewanella surugensis TaxID=212020 RepID=A0ABT0L8U1_9GAMM|nr:methylated-DNA--[protein]-cysteine S-methyltransferase [Shewanella surugensis]MCL1124109.1 methylated-DNA--[protein]-cysteine S-methyltransferase [Shewanella surugensis]